MAFRASYPDKVIPLNLRALNREFICQRDSFLCAVQGVEIEVAFTKKLGAGLFPGQSLRVDTGYIVGMSGSVNYDIQGAAGLGAGIIGGLTSGDR